MKEADVQRFIQLALAESGSLVFRNNCGATKTPQGGYVRYGVGSPGGSDLICCTPTVITQDMVGKTVGVFTAVEVKAARGRTSPEQDKFLLAVNKAGGIGFVARSAEEALQKLNDAL